MSDDEKTEPHPSAVPNHGGGIDAIRRLVEDASPVLTTADGREIIYGWDPENGKTNVVQISGPKIAAPYYCQLAHEFHDGDSLAAYVNRMQDTRARMFADIDGDGGKGRVLVILDHDDAFEPEDSVDKVRPERRLHRAGWTMRPSEEWLAWNAMEAKRSRAGITLHDQTDLLVFLEERASDITSPKSAEVIDFVRDFEAVQEATYKKRITLDNGDVALQFEEESKPLREIPIPRQLTLEFPLYEGEEAVTLLANFRWRASGGAVSMGFEWHRVQPVREAAFRAAVARAAENTGLVPHYGSVEVG